MLNTHLTHRLNDLLQLANETVDVDNSKNTVESVNEYTFHYEESIEKEFTVKSSSEISVEITIGCDVPEVCAAGTQNLIVMTMPAIWVDEDTTSTHFFVTHPPHVQYCRLRHRARCSAIRMLTVAPMHKFPLCKLWSL